VQKDKTKRNLVDYQAMQNLRRMAQVEQDLPIIPEHMNSLRFLVGFVLLNHLFIFVMFCR
jgi:hypothetical protein